MRSKKDISLQNSIWQRKNFEEINKNEMYSRNAAAAKILSNGINVLDIGCGNGKSYYYLKDKFDKIYGIDGSKEAVKIARSNGVKSFLQDINKNLKFKPQTFDAVVCLDVIDYIDNPYHLTKEANRVLKHNGELVVAFPNIRFFRHIITLIKGHFPKTSGDLEGYDGGHIHYFTSKDMIEILKKSSFEIEQIDGLLPESRIKRTIIKFFPKKIRTEFLTSGIIIKCRKA